MPAAKPLEHHLEHNLQKRSKADLKALEQFRLESKLDFDELIAAPPDDLGAKGVEFWCFILDSEASKWISSSDLLTFHRLCKLQDTWFDLFERVENDGYVLENYKTEQFYINPALNALHKVEADIARLEAYMGLGSINRAKLGFQTIRAAKEKTELDNQLDKYLD